MNKRLILQPERLEIILTRLAYQLEEAHGDFSQSAIIGLQPRGPQLASRLHKILCSITGNNSILYGELDSTFYRDDFRRTEKPLIPSPMNLEFIVEDKNIILIDDVLYTGRSVRSALNALADFGRPLQTELLVLIDRRYKRELPIEPNYTGETVDTRGNDKVKVEWDKENEKGVWILTDTNNTK